MTATASHPDGGAPTRSAPRHAKADARKDRSLAASTCSSSGSGISFFIPLGDAHRAARRGARVVRRAPKRGRITSRSRSAPSRFGLVIRQGPTAASPLATKRLACTRGNRLRRGPAAGQRREFLVSVHGGWPLRHDGQAASRCRTRCRFAQGCTKTSTLPAVALRDWARFGVPETSGIRTPRRWRTTSAVDSPSTIGPLPNLGVQVGGSTRDSRIEANWKDVGGPRSTEGPNQHSPHPTPGRSSSRKTYSKHASTGLLRPSTRA